MGIKLTGALSDYIMQHLTRWSFIDDTSDKIDQITITFNASKIASLPPYGAKYQVSIHNVSRGSWEIIGTTIDGHNNMTIKLSNVLKYGLIKEKGTASFVDKSIKDIVTAIVEPCGYKTSVTPALGAKVINFYRANETAGDCLNRLAKDHGAVSKPFNGTWLFKSKHDTTTATGKQKPVVKVIAVTAVIRIALIKSSSDTYNGVKVSYFDEGQSKLIEIVKGSEPFDDQGTVLKDKAQDIIAAYTNYNANAKERISIELPVTNTDTGKAFAQGVLDVDYSRFIKGVFIIDSVTFNEKSVKIEGSKPNEE